MKSYNGGLGLLLQLFPCQRIQYNYYIIIVTTYKKVIHFDFLFIDFGTLYQDAYTNIQGFSRPMLLDFQGPKKQSPGLIEIYNF